MKSMLHGMFIAALFACCSAKAMKEEANGEEIVETPPPWAVTPAPAMVPVAEVGCFKDSGLSRALPELIKNYRLSKIDWSNMSTIVNGCAEAAKKRGYRVFAVQFYGECWSGPNVYTTYNKYGPSKNCWNGVGKQWTNMIYKIMDLS